MSSVNKCYLVNHSKLLLLRDERIEHQLQTARFGLPEDWQRKNEVYV